MSIYKKLKKLDPNIKNKFPGLSATFEGEQREQNELEMKLRKAQEDIQKLERQLECLDGDK